MPSPGAAGLRLVFPGVGKGCVCRRILRPRCVRLARNGATMPPEGPVLFRTHLLHGGTGAPLG
ncbi:hypothetical protein ATR01nite_23060 [Acetobacter tropicalis]|uniref:Uncharacterized protein n=1 Tax=Acetobacter tropicalis TaxID=104102 RepID=A0A511FQJ7_9PROT|nr:hypothetical protein ATR01nite_23060 [Acetobacter tropicalis]